VGVVFSLDAVGEFVRSEHAHMRACAHGLFGIWDASLLGFSNNLFWNWQLFR
jgi:hypothetical protein